MRLFYYLFLKPVSALPLPVLYLFSDLLYLLGYRLLKYRTKVVWQNLRGAFPEKGEKELKPIMDDFYRHFCDLIIEAIQMFSISKEEAVRRCPVVNPELVEELYQKGRNIIIVAGHYNNWELAAFALGLQSKFTPAGIYHPFKNKFIDGRFIASRGQYGMKLIAKQETKAYFEANQDKMDAIMFGADQCPHTVHKAYWTYFMSQETPVMFGTEKYAKEYDYTVVFGHIRKLKRGHYEMEFEVITDQPRSLPHGEITERHTRMLEQDIRKAPQYWL
ncbi:MAG: lysophospholipid acyltransferase family protein, partial [Bacteroidota bacterium]